MVFYFTGTGNSRYVAEKIAEASGEKLLSIADCVRENAFCYTLQPGERIGIAYPVHAWAPPRIVTKFVEKLKIDSAETPYVYSVLTCGGDWEGAEVRLDGSLQKAGLKLQGAYRFQMPNNYVVGMELDDQTEENRKLQEAEEKLPEISKAVIDKKCNYKKIKFSVLKSIVIYYLFNLTKGIKLFNVSRDCIGCGICEKACPMKAIQMKKDRKTGVNQPKWTGTCVQCAGCINVCPKHAINYLNMTNQKKRYFHTDYRKEIIKKS